MVDKIYDPNQADSPPQPSTKNIIHIQAKLNEKVEQQLASFTKALHHTKKQQTLKNKVKKKLTKTVKVPSQHKKKQLTSKVIPLFSDDQENS